MAENSKYDNISPMQGNTIRLQKFLAQCGVASRRRCEQYIAEHRVRVNGKIITKQGTRINPKLDQVTVDHRPIPTRKQTYSTIMLYKPRGYLCSTSAKQGKTIYDLIKGCLEGERPREPGFSAESDVKRRLVPVGRLDKNSEGLLLMSNDGELINRLTHPRYQQEKAYHVTVSGNVDSMTLKKLRSRLVIDGYRIQPAKVKLLGETGSDLSAKGGSASGETGSDLDFSIPNSLRGGKVNWSDPKRAKEDKPTRFLLEFVLKEGRKRQIRKMCEAANLKVHRLIRVRIRNLTLSGLKPGQWRDLDRKELATTPDVRGGSRD